MADEDVDGGGGGRDPLFARAFVAVLEFESERLSNFFHQLDWKSRLYRSRSQRSNIRLNLTNSELFSRPKRQFFADFEKKIRQVFVEELDKKSTEVNE